MLTRLQSRKIKEEMAFDKEYFNQQNERMLEMMLELQRDVDGQILTPEEARQRLKDIFNISHDALAQLRISNLSIEDRRNLMVEISLNSDAARAAIISLSSKISKMEKREESNISITQQSVNKMSDLDYKKFADMEPFTVDPETKFRLIGYDGSRYSQAKAMLQEHFFNDGCMQEEILKRLYNLGSPISLSNKIVLKKLVSLLHTTIVASPYMKDVDSFYFRIIKTVKVIINQAVKVQIEQIDDQAKFMFNTERKNKVVPQRYNRPDYRNQSANYQQQNERPNNQWNQPNNQWNQQSNQWIQPRREINCYKCGKFGHIAYECRSSSNFRKVAYVEQSPSIPNQRNKNEPKEKVAEQPKPSTSQNIAKKINFLLDTGAHVISAYENCYRNNFQMKKLDEPFRCLLGGGNHTTMYYCELPTTIGKLTKMVKYFVLPTYDIAILGNGNFDLFGLNVKKNGIYQELEDETTNNDTQNDNCELPSTSMPPTNSSTANIPSSSTSDSEVISENSASETSTNSASPKFINTVKEENLIFSNEIMNDSDPQDEKDKVDIDSIKSEFSDVFTDSGEVGRISNEYFRLHLKSENPISLKATHLIEKSRSSYAFPVVLANKKDEGEKKRLCVDYRKLNEITYNEIFPIPHIQDIEDRLIHAKWFSVLDISNGYHHVPIDPKDRDKTAFITKYELYQWKVMPFDDIVVFSRTAKEHLIHLRKVLMACRKENIRLKASKCQIKMSSISYLGHQISQNQIKPLQSNVEAILKAKTPQNAKGVRSFLGQVNYYHRFISDRVNLCAPLIDLTKKNANFVWGEKEESAFNKIKKIMSEFPVLKIFDPDKEVWIYTDASSVGIGAVLKQQHGDTQHPVSYFSRRLLEYQTRYSATELECLAVVSALEHWKYWIMGQKIFVYTDHKPLEGIRKNKNLSSRLGKWAILLSEYQDLIIKYQPGAQNEADFISRHPIESEPSIMALTSCDSDEDESEKIEREFLSREKAKQELLRIHLDYGHIGYAQMVEHFNIKYLCEGLRDLAKAIANECDTCLRTKPNKKRLGLLGQIGPATYPFQIIHIDTVGGFNSGNTEKRYLHLAIDAFTRFVWGLSSKTQTAKDFINLMNKIICQRKPDLIVADQYPSIKSKELSRFLDQEEINLMFTPVNHPSSNGLVERVNQTITDRLRQKVWENKTKSWAKLAKLCIEEYNNTIHSVTKFPPSYLMFGNDPEGLFSGRTIEDSRKAALQNSETSHNKSKERFDKKRHALMLKPNDQVYIETGNKLNQSKLNPLYEGPYEVNRMISENMVEVKKRGKLVPVHLSQIKLYSMMLLITLATLMAEEISIKRHEPTLWRKTNYGIIEDLENNIVKMYLMTTCETLTKLQFNDSIIKPCRKEFDQQIKHTHAACRSKIKTAHGEKTEYVARFNPKKSLSTTSPNVYLKKGDVIACNKVPPTGRPRTIFYKILLQNSKDFYFKISIKLPTMRYVLEMTRAKHFQKCHQNSLSKCQPI
ncbi:Transposon Tf2-6 polyprotein [Sarcoptes scabiei]|uniref:Transposon Tf2-6 polyprotein n=1 Tax=Sarcoptes scabiei TaxID=52283 RepID=A0A834VHI5_SARSC|nr:Transposon Tf2-6 polyprotein [Sarcoptes scabiei]